MGVAEDAPAESDGLLLLPFDGNPVSTGASLRYHLPGRGPVSLDPYDVTGRPRRRLDAGVRGAGWHRVSWMGPQAGGERLPAGVYFLRLLTPWGTKTARAVVLK